MASRKNHVFIAGQSGINFYTSIEDDNLDNSVLESTNQSAAQMERQLHKLRIKQEDSNQNNDSNSETNLHNCILSMFLIILN